MKVKLHFTLVGKTDQWKKYFKTQPESFSNSDNLHYIKTLVSEQFGQRPTYIASENMLSDDAITYPKCFAASWFISDVAPFYELVVVGHGESMRLANQAVMNSIKNMNWQEVAKKI